MPSTIAHTNLRANSWPVNPVNQDTTASALVEGIYFEILNLTECSHPAISTYPPTVLGDSDPNFAWKLETTPDRLRDFILNLAETQSTIPPSAVLETYLVILSLFHAAWEQPIIIHKLKQEMELLFFQTLLNVALAYDEAFTEERFHALTRSRYVRYLDPKINLILAETMLAQASRPERQDTASWRKKLCQVFADWVMEVEVANPHDVTTSFSHWVYYKKVSRPRLETVEEVEEEPEVVEQDGNAGEAPETTISMGKVLKVETADLSPPNSNHTVVGCPPSPSCPPPAVPTMTLAFVPVPASETMASVQSSGLQIAMPNPVEDEEDVSMPPSLLPARLPVRTRPPFGSQSTNNSAADAVEDESETPDVQTAEGSSSKAAAGDTASSASASTSTRKFPSFRFSSRRSARSTLASSTTTSISTSSSFGLSYRLRKPFKRSGLANVEFQAERDSPSHDTQEEQRTTALEAADSDSSKPAAMTAASSDASRSSGSSIGTLFRKLVGLRRRSKSMDANWTAGDVVSWSPPLMTDGSDPRSTMGVEAVIHRSVHEVTDCDGKPMKRRGPWGQLMMLPALYWQLRMAERRGEV